MVDGAKRGPCAQHKRNLPAGENIGEQQCVCQRYQKPARPLDDKRSIRLRRHQKRGIDRYILKVGRQMWRGRHFQAIGLRHDTGLRHATQSFHRLTVCFFLQPGLHGLPVICLQGVGQRRGKNRLADARVGA
ncbi:hypothetical protein D3C72_1951850 [compost metagenome]